jgi:hypothetical protein
VQVSTNNKSQLSKPQVETHKLGACRDKDAVASGEDLVESGANGGEL